MSTHAGPATTQSLIALFPILQAAGLDGAVTVVAHACEDIAALSEYVERQEANMREMIEESNQREREITRLRSLIPAAMRDAEELLVQANNEVGRVCAEFNVQRVKTDALRKESVREFFIPARRQAAGA